MPEINDKNIVEQTRAEIDDANLLSRQKFHREDIIQSKRLHDQITTLQKIAKNNCDNIEKLLPIVELIPTLIIIAEDEKGKRWLAKRILNFLKIMGIIIGSLAAVFGIIWAIVKELRR